MTEAELPWKKSLQFQGLHDQENLGVGKPHQQPCLQVRIQQSGWMIGCQVWRGLHTEMARLQKRK